MPPYELNGLADENDPPVEVIVLSRNDPDTGLRVMRSIQQHDLKITRTTSCAWRSTSTACWQATKPNGPCRTAASKTSIGTRPPMP